MLPSKNRLITNFEFKITRKHGQHIEGKYTHLYALRPRGYLGPSKFGFVVTNKFEKSAPKRNRIKRLLREITRLNYEDLDLEENLWIVIQPKANIKEQPYEEVSTDLIENLQKISVTH